MVNQVYQLMKERHVAAYAKASQVLIKALIPDVATGGQKKRLRPMDKALRSPYGFRNRLEKSIQSDLVDFMALNAKRTADFPRERCFIVVGRVIKYMRKSNNVCRADNIGGSGDDRRRVNIP